VNTDLSGPAHVPGTGSVIYRLTITDDFTRWRWLKLLTNKREETILEAFKEYKAMAEVQHPACRLVTIRDDKGVEFIGNPIAAWRKEHGIQAQHTVRATPQQNGTAERVASGTWLRVLPAFWPEQGWLYPGGQRLLMPPTTSTTGSPTVQ